MNSELSKRRNYWGELGKLAHIDAIFRACADLERNEEAVNRKNVQELSGVTATATIAAGIKAYKSTIGISEGAPKEMHALLGPIWHILNQEIPRYEKDRDEHIKYRESVYNELGEALRIEIEQLTSAVSEQKEEIDELSNELNEAKRSIAEKDEEILEHAKTIDDSIKKQSGLMLKLHEMNQKNQELITASASEKANLEVKMQQERERSDKKYEDMNSELNKRNYDLQDENKVLSHKLGEALSKIRMLEDQNKKYHDDKMIESTSKKEQADKLNSTIESLRSELQAAILSKNSALDSCSMMEKSNKKISEAHNETINLYKEKVKGLEELLQQLREK
ncbi:hypothetical protein A3715_19325 [Oleiphilus sp. HI0009]|nr:hypothetical protein A3715_19325 [Oleiphilus sp. HI0009]